MAALCYSTSSQSNVPSLTRAVKWHDTCSEAAGGSFGFDWFYFNWNQDLPAASAFHINGKEVLADVLAAQRWAPFWQNKCVILYSDKSVTVACLNKGTSQNPVAMKCLRHLFWLSAAYNFHITSRHVPGIRNIAADSASRLHLPGHLETLLPFTACTPPFLHVTEFSIFCLTDSLPGVSRHSESLSSLRPPAYTQHSESLVASLNSNVNFYRGRTFAASTSTTYATQKLVYF